MPYVYVKSEPNLWTVGHYDPSGNWHTDSDHGNPEAAAARVAKLNGTGVSPSDDLVDAAHRVCNVWKDTVGKLEGPSIALRIKDALAIDLAIESLKRAL